MAKTRVEDPERLVRFGAALKTLEAAPVTMDSLASTAVALGDLAQSEIEYYYGQRVWHRGVSTITRLLALVVGSAGTMLPLIAATDPEAYGSLALWGYPCLAAAGALLLGDRLFGATGGHIRYVTTQLELERCVTSFRVSWIAFRASMQHGNATKDDLEKACGLIRAFTDDLYRTIQSETSLWGTSLAQAIADYSAKIEGALPSQSSKT